MTVRYFYGVSDASVLKQIHLSFFCFFRRPVHGG